MNFHSFLDNAPESVKGRLERLKTLRERPDFHPEPSAFHHIQIVTERVQSTNRIDLIFAAILHDICKFDTMQINEKTGWPTSPDHEFEAFELIQNSKPIQDWILWHGGDPRRVAWLCLNHMRFHQLGKMRESKRKSSIESWQALGIWEDLQILGAADNMLAEFDINNIQTLSNGAKQFL